MAFCYNCGNPLHANAKFCSSCGTKVEVDNITPPTTAPVPEVVSETPIVSEPSDIIPEKVTTAPARNDIPVEPELDLESPDLEDEDDEYEDDSYLFEEDEDEEDTEEDEDIIDEDEDYEEPSEIEYSEPVDFSEKPQKNVAEQADSPDNPAYDPYWEDVLPEIEAEIFRLPKDVIMKIIGAVVALFLIMAWFIYML